MRKRTLLTVALVGLTLIIALMIIILIYVMGGGDSDDKGVQLPAKRAKRKVIPDPYGGEANALKAIDMVKNLQVPDPTVVNKLLALRKQVHLIDNPLPEPEPKKGQKRKKKKKPTKAEKEAEEAVRQELAKMEIEWKSTPKVPLSKLLESNFLEGKLGLSFLKRGDFRAVHFDLDPKNRGAKQGIGDPFYEVQLEYLDGLVRVGPVWLVNLQAGQVLARNEMAEIFEMGPNDEKRIQELQDRPGAVVKALTNHRFESGIELGGVLLLHFIASIEEAAMNGTGQDPNNRIVGWTVAHDFGSDYVAYFQWIEAGERKVARWRFDWEKKELEPLGLLAINVTSEHSLYETALHEGKVPVSIWPGTYSREKAFLPREERWFLPPDLEKQGYAHPCSGKGIEETPNNKDKCHGLSAVLEQENFMNAVQWLISDTENERITNRPGDGYLISEGEKKGEFRPDKLASCLEKHKVLDDAGAPKSVASLTDTEEEKVIGSCVAAKIAESFGQCKIPKSDGSPADCRWIFNPVQVNINTSNLEALTRVASKKDAKAIIKHRKDKGPFLKSEDLVLVEGLDKDQAKVLQSILTADPKLTGKVPVLYQWVIGGHLSGFKFSYDPKTEAIEPLDRISNWAYWSVRIRS